MAYQITDNWLIVQQLVQANIKEKFKYPHYWSLANGNYRWLIYSRHKGPGVRKESSYHDIIKHIWELFDNPCTCRCSSNKMWHVISRRSTKLTLRSYFFIVLWISIHFSWSDTIYSDLRNSAAIQEPAKQQCLEWLPLRTQIQKFLLTMSRRSV